MKRKVPLLPARIAPRSSAVDAMMTKRFRRCGLSLLSLLLAVAVVGCELDPADPPAPAARPAAPAPKAEKKPEVKKVVITPNITLEIEGEKRRVLVAASICLQKGPLE